MERNDRPDEVRRIRVHDKRRRGHTPEAQSASGEAHPGQMADKGDTGEADAVVEGEVIETGQAAEVELEIAALQEERKNLLYQLAGSEDRRKRMMRQHTEAIERANKELIAKLLPVLDNFDRAIEHSSDAEHLDIVRKDLLRVLAEDGLEEIPAEGQPFDYHVHEAIASHEDSEVTQEIVSEVFLKGYRLKGQVLRHAQVVVASPAEQHRAEG
jgi:molecular chaperone GrpE